MDPKSTFTRSFKKLYFYRLFRAFFRLSRAFWHQRRSNFVGAAITAATVCALLGGELYNDLRWLSSPRKLLEASSGTPLSVAKDLFRNLPPQTLALLEEIGFDAKGNLNPAALLAMSRETPLELSGAGFRPRQTGPAIRWPEWAQPETESLALVAEAPAATLRPAKATAPAQPVEERQTVTDTPAPPAGEARFFWMTTPKVTPRANLQYGPPPQASPVKMAASGVSADETLSSGALRERRAGNGATLASNIEP